jgi:hypothetical protein
MEKLAQLRQECQVHHAAVPSELAGCSVPEGEHVLVGDEFLLWSDTGLGFHYRPGQGIAFEQRRPAEPGEEELWLNGSVCTAIACILGLLPLHASAVAHAGRVHAFTGASGAGKSTMVAGLGGAGFPLFCDDTLLLDITDPEQLVCLPGHKRLKLSEQALGLTGAVAQGHVGAMIEKSYAAPLAGNHTEPLPLGELIELVEGSGPRFLPLAGAERITVLNDDHYSGVLYGKAQGLDRSARFALLARLAGRIDMSRFERALDPEAFPATVTAAAAHIRGAAA